MKVSEKQLDILLAMYDGYRLVYTHDLNIYFLFMRKKIHLKTKIYTEPSFIEVKDSTVVSLLEKKMVKFKGDKEYVLTSESKEGLYENLKGE